MTVVKKIRKGKRITQKELSQRAKISQPAISYIENGTKSPTERTLKKLASALDVGHIGIDSGERGEPLMTEKEQSIISIKVCALLEDLQMRIYNEIEDLKAEIATKGVEGAELDAQAQI